MSIFQTECIGITPSPEVPTFHEQWVAGTYIVLGVFPKVAETLASQEIERSIPELYLQTKQSKRAVWPRGLCGYYLMPVYCADSFSEDTKRWVFCRPRYRWAIWHEPVLFSTEANEAFCFRNWGWYGIAFRRFIVEVMISVISSMSLAHGFSGNATLNGWRIQTAPPGAADTSVTHREI